MNRELIISAILQFDEGSKGESFQDINTERLYERLEAIAEKTDFSADELIQAVQNGF